MKDMTRNKEYVLWLEERTFKNKRIRKMKKVLKNISAIYIMFVFAASPILLFVMYITYSEKTVTPVLLITLLIAGITLKKVGV